MDERQGNGNQASPTDPVRKWLAFLVTLSSIVVVLFLGIGIIVMADPATRDQAAQLALTAILPLLGTWVGTILAYFFSQESLQTATQSVTNLTQHLTAQERLRSIPVRDKMIKRADMKAVETEPLDQIPVAKAMKDLETAKVNRLIVLGANDLPQLVIHRSFLDRYLASKSLAQPGAVDLGSLTIKDMQDDPAFQSLLGSTFETVHEEASLAEAKAKMNQTSNCQDVFVTRNGSRSEAVLGWITNVIIEENSRV